MYFLNLSGILIAVPCALLVYAGMQVAGVPLNDPEFQYKGLSLCLFPLGIYTLAAPMALLYDRSDVRGLLLPYVDLMQIFLAQGSYALAEGEFDPRCRLSVFVLPVALCPGYFAVGAVAAWLCGLVVPAARIATNQEYGIFSCAALISAITTCVFAALTRHVRQLSPSRKRDSWLWSSRG